MARPKNVPETYRIEALFKDGTYHVFKSGKDLCDYCCLTIRSWERFDEYGKNRNISKQILRMKVTKRQPVYTITFLDGTKTKAYGRQNIEVVSNAPRKCVEHHCKYLLRFDTSKFIYSCEKTYRYTEDIYEF